MSSSTFSTPNQAEHLADRGLDAAQTHSPTAALRVHSWFIDGVNPSAPAPFTRGLPTTPAEFLVQLPTDTLSCWVRGNSGLVGFGRVVRLRARGAHRFDELSVQWRTLVDRATVTDEVQQPGSGLVGLTTIAFADSSTAWSVIDVPRFLLGRRDGRVWLTSVTFDGSHNDDLELSQQPLELPVNPRVTTGTISDTTYRNMVRRATELMSAPQADCSKIVLARDCVVETDTDIDLRTVLGKLNQAYPSTWTFSIAGMVGATPELLLGLNRGRVTSRVLAGTYRVQSDPAAEMDQARAQLGGTKDSSEHQYAIDSLAHSLGEVSSDLQVDSQPHLLALANVIHLASDAHGTVAEDLSIIDIAKRVHPTAAVGGVPRSATTAALAELEQADRGRYAGPIGWIDAKGNGQLGIALRCGQLQSRSSIRLWAGAGIMPTSDPDSELAETQAKLAPMLTALGIPADTA